MSEKKALIALRDIAKHYKKGGEVVKAVDGINEEVPTIGMVPSSVRAGAANPLCCILLAQWIGRHEEKSSWPVGH